MLNMRLCIAVLLALGGAGGVRGVPLSTSDQLRSQVLAERDATVAFNYNGEKVKGVNLGGWFVLEPWITPSMFESQPENVVDEWTLTQHLGKTAAQSTMQAHWNSWYTQADFQAIAAAGLNHVRIPIGYWAALPLAGDPYVQGQLPILDKAVQWAQAAGLKVLLDLHGAPGSQNGFDNSGHNGSVNWQAGGNANVQNTINALNILAQRYANSQQTVVAVELLNEPLGPMLNLDEIRNFYTQAYDAVRQHMPNVAIVIHDAFENDVTYWNGFMGSGSQYYNVILDTHIYTIFTPQLNSLSPSGHVSSACSSGNTVASTDKWTVVGEWTGAQTDCAKWLNGRGRGARYDGSFPGSWHIGSCDGKYTGTVAALSSDDKENLKSYINAQLDAYDRHTGWIFWAWKTESAPEWHMHDLLANGLFPASLQSSGSPCGY